MKNKKENIIVLFFIVVAVVAFAFNYKFNVGDELWNFSNMYKMSQGYTIYKDLNVIITPLTFYIEEIVFKLFGANVLINKIYNVFICTCFYFAIYKLFRELKLSKMKSALYTCILYFLTFYIIMGGTNYNILALTFCFTGIIFILKDKPCWLQGIIIFLIFMTKQNIGIYYGIGYVIAKLVQKNQNFKISKENIKCLMKEILIPVGIFITLFAMYLIYLYTQNNLYNFINYTFLGISEFGEKNLKFELDSLMLLAITVLIIYPTLLFILNFKRFNVNNEIKQNAFILMSFAIPLLFIAYPLINKWHTDFGLITSYIMLIYIMEKAFLEELTDNKIAKRIINLIIICALIGLTIFGIIQNINYANTLKAYDYYDVYYGAVLDKDIKEEIDKILEYINSQENQTIILSCYSNLYMNILNRNNGKMDLPFYGNLGKEGEDGLIKEIDNLDNTNLLITKEEGPLFQESKKVREHIINNYEQIGEIGRYLIYKIN